MKFSQNGATKKLGMIYTILGSLLGEADIRPQIRPRKIPDPINILFYFMFNISNEGSMVAFVDSFFC